MRLYADTKNCRAWPGGMGFAKAGGNYAPTILPAVAAKEEHDCAQARLLLFCFIFYPLVVVIRQEINRVIVAV